MIDSDLKEGWRMKRIYIPAITLWISLMAIPPVYAYGLDDMEGVDIHGFISQGYLYTLNNNWMGDTKDGTWQFNELGINFTSMLTQRLRIGMQFFARDIGEIGNDEIVIDWAFADYILRDWLGIRIGQMKNPYGFYGESRDIDFLRNSVFLPQTIYYEGVRDSYSQTKGAGIYGNIDTGTIGLFKYLALYGITSIDLDSGTAMLFEEKTTTGISTAIFPLTLTNVVLSNSDVDITYTINLEWTTPLEGLRIGANFTRIDYNFDFSYTITSPFLPSDIMIADTIKLDQELWIASIEYTWADLILTAEFLRTYIGNFAVHGQAWYAMASYRLSDWFALGGSYGENYENEDDKDGNAASWEKSYYAYTKTAAFFARFDINDHWLMKAEYQYNDGVNLLSRRNNIDASGNVVFERIWHFIALKITFNF